MNELSSASRKGKPNLKHQIRLRLVLVLGALVLFGLGSYVLATVPPTANSWYPKCQLHQQTGLHCPGCGITRAIHALLQGHILDALSYNAVAVLFLPFATFWAARFTYRWVLVKPHYAGRGLSNRWTCAILIAILIFSIARNIPVAPFTELAPKEIPPSMPR